MKLRSFLDTPKGSSISMAEWARRIGVTRGYFSQLANGDKMPSIDVAWTIEKATQGEVRMQDWVDPDGGADDQRLRGDDSPAVEKTAAG